MFRLLAIVLILYGSVGYALKLCQEMRTRIRHIAQMKEIFGLFMSEISYSRITLPEACYQVAVRAAEPYKTALEKIYRKTFEKSGVCFPDIWKMQMEQCLREIPVKKEEKAIFLEFGNQLGFSDLEMQVGVLHKNIAQLDELYKKTKGALENQEKVITGVGILGGLMLVIILI